jgi:hypothetical protein
LEKSSLPGSFRWADKEAPETINSPDELKRAIREAVEWYNNSPHEALKNISPKRRLRRQKGANPTMQSG